MQFDCTQVQPHLLKLSKNFPADKNTALFGECKWRNESVDLGVLETLVERSKFFNFDKKHFYIFSKSGFTKGCIDKANELGNVSLIAYDDILKYNNEN